MQMNQDAPIPGDRGILMVSLGMRMLLLLLIILLLLFN
jgi:hypothetical protein